MNKKAYLLTRSCHCFNKTVAMAGENTAQISLKNNLKDWNFSDKPNYKSLPFDKIKENYARPNITHAIFSEAALTPLQSEPRLVCHSEDALVNILDMDPSITATSDFVNFIAGQNMPSSAFPVAHRYGGHQFGTWAGQLGDGRAHLLGEYVNRKGEHWELQLKGSGCTPYSRVHDGRAVLRSSVREMVASEACHALGIPTTRAAALVVSNDPVLRDEFYRGHMRAESAAIVLRLSPSWFRFGSLEILTEEKEFAELKILCDYVIKVHYPQISLADEDCYVSLFSEVSKRTVDLVAKWQGLGFAHGVLNTDNMSLLGLTIDYGPFGFVDSYDGGFVPNKSDGEGRYALSKQPQVVLWNLSQLASALAPLLGDSQREHVAHVLKNLELYTRNQLLETFLEKLGLRGERLSDESLIEKLLVMMQDTGADFTMTFRQLAELDPSELLLEASLDKYWALKRLSAHAAWGVWVEAYRDRVAYQPADSSQATIQSESERRLGMLRVNPRYIPRNWMLHEAIQAAQNNDFSKVTMLLRVLRDPYTEQADAEERGFASEPPRWAYSLRLSCSS